MRQSIITSKTKRTFMREKAFLWICFCLLSIGIHAQNTPKSETMIQITTTIVDIEGTPLPGATIKVKGKPVGVIADVDGKISLWVEKGNTITVSYLGMKSRVLKINSPLTKNIVLENDAETLDQVVVTGYTRTTKKRVTGSVATITAKDLDKNPTANLDMLLKGKMAGVDIKAVSGRPGETAKVRIRGINTITGNADPLWVVDGVPLQKDFPVISKAQMLQNNFSDIFATGIAGINPNDIESVTVLKDASAAAIYGSRAAGGVIVVTTKRGVAGKLRINYSINATMVTRPPRSLNLMNSQEKLSWEQELWKEFSLPYFSKKERYPVIGAVGMIRSGYGPYKGMTKEQQDAEIERLGSHTTNWFDELFRNSLSQSHNLSLSGGTDKSTYYVSLGYLDNVGLVKKTDYSHYSINSKLDMKPTKRIKLGLSLDLGWQTSNSPSLVVDLFKYAYFANPYERPYDEHGNYTPDMTYQSIGLVNGGKSLSPLPDNGFNIMRELDETLSKTQNFSSTVIGNLSINILNNLCFEGLASYSYTTNNGNNVLGKHTYAAWIDRPFDQGDISSKRIYSSIAQSSSYNSSYNVRGQLHYFNTFKDKHYFSSLLGAEVRGQYIKSIYTKCYGYDPVSGNSAMPVFPESKEFKYNDLKRYALLIDNLSGRNIVEDRFASFYFSADYVYNNRYIVSFTGRTDGSNNFGSKEQFNPTGSLGLSWNVDQEAFMAKLKSVISSLSVRTAYGFTGNINKSVYPQLVMDYRQSFRKTDTDYYRMGFIKKAPNPNLRWEKTCDMKLSVDMGLFNDRIRLIGEVYKRITSDVVSDVFIPYSTGFQRQAFNTSKLSNTGAELTLSAGVIKSKNWNFFVSGNVAYNRNRLLEYKSVTSGLSEGVYVGYPIGAIFSGKVKEIDRRLGMITYEVRPDAVFETAADHNNADNYRFYLGTSNAPTNGGYSMTLSYKQISMSLAGSFSLGGKIINEIKCPVYYGSVQGTKVEYIPTQVNDLYVNHLNVVRDVVNRWTPANHRTDAHPRILDRYGKYYGLDNYIVSAESIVRASMLEDVSYLKIGSLSLAYSFNNKLIQRIGLRSLNVSFIADNIYTFTNYSGLDPESPGAVYPMARSFSMGVLVGF